MNFRCKAFEDSFGLTKLSFTKSQNSFGKSFLFIFVKILEMTVVIVNIRFSKVFVFFSGNCCSGRSFVARPCCTGTS